MELEALLGTMGLDVLGVGVIVELATATNVGVEVETGFRIIFPF